MLKVDDCGTLFYFQKKIGCKHSIELAVVEIQK